MEAGVVEPDGALPLQRHERRDGPVGQVEEGQPRAAGGGPRDDRPAKEPLHTRVHELGLALAGAAMQGQELVEAGLDAGRRGLPADTTVGGFALEAPELAADLVAMLAGERGEESVPGLG